MLKINKDRENKFISMFNTATGQYIRTGVLEDGKDTGVDPFMASFPELIDIGIMGHCVHGESGLCAKSGIQCYQNGLYVKEPNMKLSDFKRIVDECKDKTFQFALGGRGDVDQHEDFEEILRYCRENDIVPNFTTSGLGLTAEKIELCKKYCGAVAISMYSRLNDIVPEIAVRKVQSGEIKKVYLDENDIPVRFTLGGIDANCM